MIYTRLLIAFWFSLMLVACGSSNSSDTDTPAAIAPPADDSIDQPIDDPIDEPVVCEVAPQPDPVDLPFASGSVLVFSETRGFRHSSIPQGIEMMQNLAEINDWDIDTTEDSSDFTPENLAQYNVVVWLNTTGDVLNDTEQDAFQAYIEGGGGYVGIHAAADTEFDWPWYEDLVGAYFLSHPEIQQAEVVTEDNSHPATEHLNPIWTRIDEWYNFQSNPREDVNVLLTLDESSYNPGQGAMGDDHPITWYHELGDGRSFYTALGHTEASYTEPDFVTMVEEAVLWAGRMQRNVEVWGGDPPPDSDFTTEIIDIGINMPIGIDISDEGDVFVIGRFGEFYALEDGDLVVKSTLAVGTSDENGLFGMALDPNFTENRHVFLHYTAVTGDEVFLSRMTILEDNTLDPDSEIVLLQYPIFPACCHVAGDLGFDSRGNLYIATGDNSNPFESDGYTPIDERDGRELFDAQRSSANTNDLRGKILRITPQPDGSYTIPDGNLFVGDDEHRPEIYTMGHRNPFRIGLDSAAGYLVWADIGPDANFDNPQRGPAGLDEVNRTFSPGNFGWPYFLGGNIPYVDFDFATNQTSDPFDPNNVVNESVNNTGATDIPNAIPSWFSTGRQAFMLTDVYRWDAQVEDEFKLPSFFNGRIIVWNFNNDEVFELDVNSDNPQLRRWLDTSLLDGIIDADISPQNNRLYFVAFGGNCCDSPPFAGALAEVRFTGSNPALVGVLPFSTGDQIAFVIQARTLSVGENGEVSLLDTQLIDIDSSLENTLFEIVDAGDGAVAFRSAESGLFLSLAEDNESLIANASEIEDDQRFDLIQNEDGTQSLRSLSNCQFVGIPDIGSSQVTASFPDTNGTNTDFQLEQASQ